jgi:hypothetical protein
MRRRYPIRRSISTLSLPSKLNWFQSLWSMIEKRQTMIRKGRRYLDVKKNINPTPPRKKLTCFQSL